jgi:hypothetical protein
VYAPQGFTSARVMFTCHNYEFQVRNFQTPKCPPLCFASIPT